MIKVKIKKLHEKAVIPKQATDLAGGWDIIATEIIKEQDDFVICKLGFALQPPPNYKITLVPRSSLTGTKWIIQNSPGLGDADYLQEYQIRFRAIPASHVEIFGHKGFMYTPFPYKVGDRIAQLYLEEVIPIEFEEVKELLPVGNRKGGFGSSGI